MLSINKNGTQLDLNSVFEAVGSFKVGAQQRKMVEYENNACPGCGSCSGMFTANSMVPYRSIVMGLPGNELSQLFMQKEFDLQNKQE